MRLSSTVLNSDYSLKGRNCLVTTSDHIYDDQGGRHTPELITMTCRVSQGLIILQPLFNLYMFPHGQIIYDNKAAYHTDMTHINLALSPSDNGPLDSLNRCLE